ncbi:hypothetical protein LguiB_035696 [Lonicera macranthoides]
MNPNFMIREWSCFPALISMASAKAPSTDENVLSLGLKPEECNLQKRSMASPPFPS